VDLVYIDPPFNSNRNYEVFWGETKEKRAFEDRHASTQAYIQFRRHEKETRETRPRLYDSSCR
jgi:16S rRNA G966 N2-methylase RsmD